MPTPGPRGPGSLSSGQAMIADYPITSIASLRAKPEADVRAATVAGVAAVHALILAVLTAVVTPPAVSVESPPGPATFDVALVSIEIAGAEAVAVEPQPPVAPAAEVPAPAAAEVAMAAPVPETIAAEVPPDPLSATEAEAVVETAAPAPKPRRRPRPAQAASPPVVPGDSAAGLAAPGPPGPVMPAAAGGGVTVEPAAISCRAPAYPSAARRRGETGTVEMRLLVDVDGRVVERALDRSSGSSALDAAALEALSECRFKPGSAAGQPQRAWVKLRYVWELE